MLLILIVPLEAGGRGEGGGAGGLRHRPSADDAPEHGHRTTSMLPRHNLANIRLSRELKTSFGGSREKSGGAQHAHVLSDAAHQRRRGVEQEREHKHAPRAKASDKDAGGKVRQDLSETRRAEHDANGRLSGTEVVTGEEGEQRLDQRKRETVKH